MQTVSNPIAVTIPPKNDNSVNPGNIISNCIEIKNNNPFEIKVDIWLVAVDEKSQPLLYWCEFEKSNERNKRLQFPLILSAKASCDIDLNFRVPPQAQPGLYKYEILIDYSDKPPIRRPQQLRVLRSDITSQQKTKPEFSLEPSTNSSEPLLLKAGERREIKVKVENKSRRVDTFYLTCPDLDQEWFTLSYPESPFIRPGLVRETDGLDLNPRQSGECTLILHPPKYQQAGSYYPTVKLISQNNESLVLLDVVYLKILPNPSLSVDMNPQSLKISGKSKYFHVQVSNEGNFDREVKFTVDNRDDIFNYTFDCNPIQLSPAEDTELFLKVKPKRWKWWLRCFKARQQEINFDLKLENDEFLPPEEVLAQGTLIWVSRPWKLFWFLIALGILSLGGVGFLLWNKYLKYHLPPSPYVTNLSTTNKSNSYQKGEAVLLNWDINHFDKVKKVVFVTLHNNVEIERKKHIITHKNSFLKIIQKTINEENNGLIKSGLKNSNLVPTETKCDFLINNTNVLACETLSHFFDKSGKYVFKVEVFTSENSTKPVDVEQKTITVYPHPIPRISSLVTDKPNYQASKDSEQPPVTLKWDMSNANQVKELNLIALKPDNSVHFQKNYNFTEAFDTKKNDYFDIEPKSNDTVFNDSEQEFEKIIECEKKDAKNSEKTEKLICNLTFPQGLEPGDYIFKLGVVPKNKIENQKLEFAKTPVIKVLPIPPTPPPAPIPNPQILNFSPSATAYREVSSNKSQNNKYQPKSNSEKILPPPIRLNWSIVNTQKIKQIKIISLDANGTLTGETKYNLNQGVPSECELEGKNLSCTGIPTNARKAGSYQFNLVVIYKDKETYSEIIKSTPNIKIQPPPTTAPEPPKPPTPVEIAYFKVNGKDASQNPKQIIEVHREIEPPNIILSWKVKEGEDIEVELLPSPGLVPTKKNSLSIPISKSSGSETITLKAKNKQTGEEKIQSVVIQTVDITPPNLVQPLPNPQPQQGFPDISNPGASENNSGNSSENNNPTQQPSNSNELPPIELPPQPDSSSRD